MIGVEPEDAAGMTLSSKAGQVITLPTVRMPAVYPLYLLLTTICVVAGLSLFCCGKITTRLPARMHARSHFAVSKAVKTHIYLCTYTSCLEA